MTTITALPAVPETVPVITMTSHSEDNGPEHYGIDPTRQWWAEAVRRPRFGDARASVTAPGADEPLVTLSLPADDLDEAEETARYAIDIARQLVRVLGGDDEGVGELSELLSPYGPMGGTSEAVRRRVTYWLLVTRQTGVATTLEL